MYDSILVVCVGNICRSPVGERLLRKALPDKKVDSAGLAAVVGHAADETAARVAAEHGIDVEGHVAQQLTGELGRQYDLILVMEPAHRQAVMNSFPQLSGRVMLFDQWTGAGGVRDPFRKPIDFHQDVIRQLVTASQAWADKLGNKK